MDYKELGVLVLICAWLFGLTFIVADIRNDINAPIKPSNNPVDKHLELVGGETCYTYLVKIRITNYTYDELGMARLTNISGEPYQISSGNFTIAGNTDEEGTIIAPLCPTTKYELEITNHTIRMYPSENSYRVMLQ